MERLTRHENNGFITFKQEKPHKLLCREKYCDYSFACESVQDRTCPYLKMIDRLAEYEDTGLTPAEVRELIEKDKKAADV